jgi:glutathione synthase/RimK-type ligase-like ATP-grasp enzyme
MTVATDSQPGVGILMPSEVVAEKFSIRYENLEAELTKLGSVAIFAFGHKSYNFITHNFQNGYDTKFQQSLPIQLDVIRDLTMPKEDNKPVYTDTAAPILVHDPSFSAFLRNKRNVYNLLPEVHPQTIAAKNDEIMEAAAAICGTMVVVKPVTGEKSQDIFIGKKENLTTEMPKGEYLVQEFIDTSAGVPELAIKHVHNVRVLSINSRLVGAVGRINNAGGHLLYGEANDVYGKVYLPEELPETMLAIASKVQDEFKTLAGSGRNVIAIDLMRGFNSNGEEVDVLCEVNRRPLRISAYDLQEPQLDPDGIAWLAEQWDIEEAMMLDNIGREEH